MPESNLDMFKKKIESLPGNSEVPAEPPATEEAAMENEEEMPEVPAEPKSSDVKNEGMELGKACKEAYKRFEQELKNDPQMALDNLIEDLKNLKTEDKESDFLPGDEAPINVDQSNMM